MTKIEIMAPAGSYEALMAAINAGANSVYFGIEQLNMRARAANNFTTEDLKKIVKICKEHNVKTYLTLNTIMYDHDITLMKKICDTAKEAGVTAAIASDIAAMQYAKSIDLEVHVSTQANVSNFETIKFYAQFADVIVLARELTLKQVQSICDQIKEEQIKGPSGNLLQVELFVHGAMCVAISGKCYMSLATHNASANRGACLQNCRKAYRVIDDETGQELKIENKYVMSPKDLCTIPFLDKILATGVSVLKIEGRGRAPDYVHTTVQCYREAADAFEEGTYTQEKIDAWMIRLESVYNRGFWKGGYYLGKEINMWSGEYGSQATREKQLIGRATHYFSQKKIGVFQLESRELNVGDSILITGPTTGVIEETVKSIFVDEKEVQTAKKGDEITIPIATKIRNNDKLFVVHEKKKPEQKTKEKQAKEKEQNA